MTRQTLVLVVDDDETILRTLEYHLGQAGYGVLSAANGKDAFLIAQEDRPDIVVTDLKIPGIDGINLVSKVHSLDPRCVIIVITAHGTIESAVEAMKRGAFDFITKPFGRDDMLRAVEKASRLHSLIRENVALRSLALERYQFDRIITASPAMKELIDVAARVAQTDSTVLISGESGTGKDLLARAIHFASRRSQGPYLPVNLGAVPEGLADDELFGHRKGAFTGAIESRAGAFEEAEGGTLFLDEIGDLPPATQVKLLRVLQEREFNRLGETKLRPVDVRIISATNRDLEAEVEAGRFREDLYYRLCVVPFVIPPLRARREDIPLLIQHFLERHSTGTGREPLSVSPEDLKRLADDDWPGNVRQLENMIERLVAQSPSGTLTPGSVPDTVGARKSMLGDLGMVVPPEGVSLEEVEKALIRAALERCGGNQTRAAKFLRMTRNTLVYRMDKHGIKRRR